MAALAVITPGALAHDRVDDRDQVAEDLERPVEVAGVDASHQVGVLLAGDVADHRDQPGRRRA